MATDVLSPTEIKSPEIKVNQAVAQNRVYLRQVVGHYLGSLDEQNQLPRDENGVLQVLSVGCGFAYEAKPIIDIFPNSHYKGIDNKEHISLAAAQVNPDLSPEEANFLVEDARNVEEGEANKYGLVVIRHPQVMGSILPEDPTVEDWKRIIESSVKKTAPNGYLFISTELEREKEIILRYLLKNKIDILLAEPNRYQEVPSSLVFKDLIVTIGRK